MVRVHDPKVKNYRLFSLLKIKINKLVDCFPVGGSAPAYH
jgi:hypothetical protein